MLQCHHCGAAVEVGEPIPRDAECDSCRKDLRSCLNCRHYDPRYNNACTEPMADPVEDKGRRNFCEYFYFSRAPFVAGPTRSGRESGARAKLDRLFEGKSPGTASPGAKASDVSSGERGPSRSREDDARAKLDRLFKKPGESSSP